MLENVGKPGPPYHMLSIEECRKYLGKVELTDKQVEQLRDAITEMVGCLLDELFK